MIRDVCHREVHTISPISTVAEAAKLMADLHVGDLFVVESKRNVQRVVGVLTDRDIVTKIIAESKSPDTPVAGVMNRNVIKTQETDGIQDTISKMKTHAVRRVAVVNEQDELCGVLAIDDLYALLSKEFSEISEISNHQIMKEMEPKKISIHH